MWQSCPDGIERLSYGRYCAILLPLFAHGEDDVRRHRVPQTDQRPPKTFAAGEQYTRSVEGAIRFGG
jgi:hypothetical protein